MGFDQLTQEQQIMVSMRKVLTSIIREITPAPGEKYPLSQQTVEDVRMCLTLIAARERELAEEKGIEQQRPYFIDEPQTTQTISLEEIQHNKKFNKKTEH
jgi:hypothetical protein